MKGEAILVRIVGVKGLLRPYMRKTRCNFYDCHVIQRACFKGSIAPEA